MPNIPTQIDAELEAGIGRGLNIPTGGAEAYGMAGRHVAQQIRVLGEGAANVANQIEQHETIQQVSDLNNAATSKEQQYRDAWAKEVATNPKADPDSFIRDNVLPDWQKQGDNLSTDKAREHYSNLSRELIGGLSTQFHAERNKLDLDNADSSANDATEQAKKDAYDNPANLPSILTAAKTKVDGLFTAANVPAGLKADHFRQQDAGIADAAADGMAHWAEGGKGQVSSAQIDAARTLLQDPNGPYRANMSAAQYRAINDRLDKAQATLGNIDAAVQDVQRPVLLTALRQGDPKAYDTLTQMAANPKGDTPKERAVYTAEVTRDRDEAQSFYEGSKTIANMPQQDARNLVESMPIEGARTPAQKGIVEAYKDREEGLNKDATGWISTHNQTASNAYAAWQQNPNPQTWAKFAIVQTGIQKQLRPDEPVHLLTPETKAQAADIVRSITQTPEGAAGASKQLFQMAQTFGGSWHSIAHDLMDEHVLSREQYTAARLYGDPSRQGEGERILTASAMKPGDRFDMKGIPEAKARKEAQTALAPFASSLGNVNDRADVLAGFTDALTHVLQVNGDGNNLSALATSEANKMLLSDYSFAGATHTIRVPSGVDSDTVTSASEHALSTIDTHDLVIPQNFGTMNAANHAQNYKRTIQLTGQWYTNEDGSGIKLYDQDMHNVMEKKNGKAVPVELKWDDLTRGAAYQAAQPGQTGEENINSYTGR